MAVGVADARRAAEAEHEAAAGHLVAERRGVVEDDEDDADLLAEAGDHGGQPGGELGAGDPAGVEALAVVGDALADRLDRGVAGEGGAPAEVGQLHPGVPAVQRDRRRSVGRALAEHDDPLRTDGQLDLVVRG